MLMLMFPCFMSDLASLSSGLRAAVSSYPKSKICTYLEGFQAECLQMMLNSYLYALTWGCSRSQVCTAPSLQAAATWRTWINQKTTVDTLLQFPSWPKQEIFSNLWMKSHIMNSFFQPLEFVNQCRVCWFVRHPAALVGVRPKVY